MAFKSTDSEYNFFVAQNIFVFFFLAFPLTAVHAINESNKEATLSVDSYPNQNQLSKKLNRYSSSTVILVGVSCRPHTFMCNRIRLAIAYVISLVPQHMFVCVVT